MNVETSMDLAALAAVVTGAIAPCLGFLLGLAGKIPEGAAQKLGEDGLAWLQKLWGKLKAAIASNPAADEATRDLAQNPDDADLQAAFRVQVKKLLSADPALAAAIAQILSEQPAGVAASVSIQLTSVGNQNQAIGQVSGSGNTISQKSGN